MRVQIFRGSGRVFAVVEPGSDQRLPERYGPWALFKSIELMPGQVQPGVDVGECLDDIARFGIHVTNAHVGVTEDAIR